jgi:hypothetical protein
MTNGVTQTLSLQISRIRRTSFSRVVKMMKTLGVPSIAITIRKNKQT